MGAMLCARRPGVLREGECRGSGVLQAGALARATGKAARKHAQAGDELWQCSAERDHPMLQAPSW